eukprot:3512362-Rhodomonas_salina.2
MPELSTGHRYRTSRSSIVTAVGVHDPQLTQSTSRLSACARHTLGQYRTSHSERVGGNARSVPASHSKHAVRYLVIQHYKGAARWSRTVHEVPGSTVSYVSTRHGVARA